MIREYTIIMVRGQIRLHDKQAQSQCGLARAIV